MVHYQGRSEAIMYSEITTLGLNIKTNIFLVDHFYMYPKVGFLIYLKYFYEFEM